MFHGEKLASAACNSNSYLMLFLKKPLHFYISARSHSALCALPILSPQIFKIWIFKAQNITKCITFTTSSRTFLSESEFSFYCDCMEVKDTVSTNIL